MLEIINVMAKLVVPGFCDCQQFVHGKLVVSTLFQGAFGCVNVQQDLTDCAFSFRTAEPAQCGPHREPSLNFRGPLFGSYSAFAKGRLNRRTKCFSLPKCSENRKFL